ncbi:MAG: SUMF1/EgtB/PvdO family nonheme iron enzyme, partial [Acidobacteriota bacterium]|nr:SUMF1/EgtB/PvdO family nonheme iron enzyme [Acidobacteriota bacterium]
MADSPSESTPSSPRVGLTILIALVLGVTIWMSIHRPAESPLDQPFTPPPEALPTLLPGFRADAWFLPYDDLLGFVEIPAGPFLMGSNPTNDPEAFDNERWSVGSSQGTVELPSYFIGRYEVTVAQFAAFIAATGFGGSIDALRDPPNHP